MSKFLNRLFNVDQRFVYLFVAIGTALPLLFPLNLPISVTKPVKDVYDFIQKLEPGDSILLSYDYGPSTAPENDPMADAVLRHCFERKIKVVVIALYPLGGVTLAEQSLNRVAKEYPALKYGVDYVNLGYKDGVIAVMKAMGEDIHKVFPQDLGKKPISELPMMANIHNYSDLKLVVSLPTGIIGEYWAALINSQYGIPIALGSTAVSAPKYYAFLKSGQIIGLLGGVKSASEYEKLLIEGYPATKPAYEKVGTYNAMKGMDVQSVVHIIIIAFIVLGNLAYFTSRAAQKKGDLP